MRVVDLFGSYRQLERELAEMTAARLAAEDKVRRLEARMETLEEQSRSDREDALRCRERVADFLAKRSGLGTIFGPLEAVPDAPVPDMKPVGRSTHARSIVEEGERIFNEMMSGMMTGTPNAG